MELSLQWHLLVVFNTEKIKHNKVITAHWTKATLKSHFFSFPFLCETCTRIHIDRSVWAIVCIQISVSECLCDVYVPMNWLRIPFCSAAIPKKKELALPRNWLKTRNNNRGLRQWNKIESLFSVVVSMFHHPSLSVWPNVCMGFVQSVSFVLFASIFSLCIFILVSRKSVYKANCNGSIKAKPTTIPMK